MLEYQRTVPDSQVKAFEQAIAKIDATAPGSIELGAICPGAELGTTLLVIRYTYGMQLFALGILVGQVERLAEGGQDNG